MHRFLRAAGFSMYQKKKDIRALLRCRRERREPPAVFSLTGRPNYMRSRQKLAPGIGVAMYGELRAG